MTTADVTELALGVVRDLLPELESFEVTPKPPPVAHYPFPNDAELWLHVTAAGESFYLPLTGDPSVQALEERLESNLQDWIAESKFGWGQQRVRG